MLRFLVSDTNDGKNTLKVSKNNKASMHDLVPMLLTSIREEGGRGGEVRGELNNWTEHIV